MQALETRHNGYRFRSRLEARWAVFFDTLGVPYEYEKEGFDLGQAGWYLPDFWLPKQDAWVEIKGQYPTDEESHKCEVLAICGGSDVFLFYGPCEVPRYDGNQNDSGHAWLSRYDPVGWDNCYQFCVCPYCQAVGIQFDGRHGRMRCCETSRAEPDDSCYSYDHPRICKAFDAAKAARFGT